MIDLGFLDAPLSPPAALPTADLDAALDQVVSLAERNQFASAGQAAAQLWNAHIYDVRTLGILLYAAFAEQGMAALDTLFAAASRVITEHWSSVGPAASKERHLDGALRWLATCMISHFRFSQKLNPSEWQKLLRDWEKADQARAFAALRTLSSHLDSLLSSGQARGSVAQLHKLLRELPTTQPDPPPLEKHNIRAQSANAARDDGGADADPSDVLPLESVKMKPQDQNVDAASLPSAGRSPSATISGTAAQPTLVIPLSPPMLALLKKLGAFNRLVRLGRFKHAAIVYKDIKETIEKFDPRLYLPSVFGEYFSNIVMHADKLLPSLDTQDDFAHRALLDLYRIDLELFILATT